MVRRLRLGPLCAALALASLPLMMACTTTTPSPPPAQVALPEAVADQRSLAAYMERVRAMSTTELQQETDALAAAQTPFDRLRAAIAVAATAHPARDEALAQRIAEEIAAGPAPAALRDWAALYAQTLADRRRAADEANRLRARTRDDGKRVETLEARVRDLERRAGEAERRAGEAERKLEALKQIDKALSDRMPGINPAPRAAGSGGAR